ncbi:hypothetical protein FHG87_017899 [Trinorchestia longiramus]|nr:hypothetical protein FHG87_017899 [Trinorchestia longiramus]
MYQCLCTVYLIGNKVVYLFVCCQVFLEARQAAVCCQVFLEDMVWSVVCPMASSSPKVLYEVCSTLYRASGNLFGGLLGGGSGGIGGQNLFSIVNGLVKCLVGGLGVESVINLSLNLGVAAGVTIDFDAIIAAVQTAAPIQTTVLVGAGGGTMGGSGSAIGSGKVAAGR